MKKTALFIIAAASIAAAVGGLAFGTAAIRQRKSLEAETRALRRQLARLSTPEATNTNAAGSTVSPALFSTEISRLRGQLAEKESELEQLRTAMPATNRPPREGFAERMARMKEDDPEGYAEVLERRQERQQAMRYGMAERTAAFMDIDTSGMSPEERTNHELLIEKMADVWTLTEQFQSLENTPDPELRRELAGKIREVSPLLEQERAAILRQLGSELGYEDDDAAAFAAHIEDIFNATTIRPPRGRRRSRN